MTLANFIEPSKGELLENVLLPKMTRWEVLCYDHPLIGLLSKSNTGSRYIAKALSYQISKMSKAILINGENCQQPIVDWLLCSFARNYLGTGADAQQTLYLLQELSKSGQGSLLPTDEKLADMFGEKPPTYRLRLASEPVPPYLMRRMRNWQKNS